MAAFNASLCSSSSDSRVQKNFRIVDSPLRPTPFHILRIVMQQRNLLLIITLVIGSLFLAGCFPVDGGRPGDDRDGFFMGIWHGWIAPVSIVLGIFDSQIRVYEVHNTGWWYDFGYYMAIISGFGGLSLLRRSKEKDTI